MTPVVGLWLPDCCWPLVVVLVAAPVVMPVVTPSALAVLAFANWLFVVAFVGEVCACTLDSVNASDTRTSAAIQADLCIVLFILLFMANSLSPRRQRSWCWLRSKPARHLAPVLQNGQRSDTITVPSTIWKMFRLN